MKRLRFVADINPPVDGLSRHDAGREISFLPLDCVWADHRFDPTQVITFSGEPQSYNPVAEGDLLVPKVSPTFAHGRTAIASGLIGGCALATSEVFVVRSHDPSAARFLKYRLLASDFLQSGQAAWFGVAGLKRISADFLLNTRIEESAWQQREAIADFLDRESERIGLLLARVAALQASASELECAEIDERFHASALSRLGWLASVQTGLTLGKDFASVPGAREFPYLRVANVHADRIKTDDVVSVIVSPDVVARTTLRKDDVLMTEGGDIDKLGRGAVWDGRLDPCLHQNHVFAVRCGPHLEPEFLAVWTRGSVARSYFERTASRITNIASTNLTKLKALPVPELPVAEQRRRLAEFTVWQRRQALIAARMDALVRTVDEYRSSLILEAVSGTLDVRRVSEQLMEDRMCDTIDSAMAKAVPT